MEHEGIRKESKKFFEDISPSHDWLHVKRVYRLAETIAREEDADLQTVRLATLLHDIGRQKEDQGEIDDHAEWGAEKAKEILEREGYGDKDAVISCIRSHRYSTDPEPETLEAKILSDADNLDALGASGIARTFAYAGERKGKLMDTDLPVEEDDSAEGKTALNHLQKKILSLKDRMYTDTGRSIAEERHRFVEGYVERLQEEMKGDL